MDTNLKAGLKSYLAAPLITLMTFTIASLIFAFVIKDKSPIPVFIIFCTVQVICMLLFALLPGRGKTISRITAMFIIGSFLVILAGIMGHNNFQIESFFFYLISGTMGGVIVHYSMAKIIGPLLFNRIWCSWGCWTSMILDLLPYKTSNSWKKGGISNIRYYHFAVSLLLVAILFLGFKYTFINTDLLKSGMGSAAESAWFLIGNILYYITAISLALIMKDNRAFCKYICPITVFYKIGTRFSLLRIAGYSKKCTNCKTCVKNCPMSIDIPTYIKNGERVKSTECIMCMNCVASCPQAALKTSLGLDYAKKNNLNLE